MTDARTTRNAEVVLHREDPANIAARTVRNIIIVFVKREMPGWDAVKGIEQQADTVT